ncbi:small ribosomal subunit protein mS39 [Pelodytes ibericus]
MALPCVRLGAVKSRPGTLFRYLCASTRLQAAAGKCHEEIVIPKKKTWDKTAVLQALACTVNHDPTSAQYMFQDDPYLVPKTNSESRIFSLSKESGKNAAKYVFNTFPKYFLKDIAEPHIPCLMPENFQPQIEDVSEEALNERIQLRKVKDSVDLYDQLLQGGNPPSLETRNRLLDLLCFYGDREPDHNEQNPPIDTENGVEIRKTRGPFRKNSDILTPWRENNNAERIFNLMPERNSHTYCTMIRGMVKYGSPSRAFDMFTDLLNNRMTADVYTFNALILAAPQTKEPYSEKIDLIMELLKHMVQQKVQPNLLTFNCVLNSLRKCGGLARGLSLQTLSEMKALRIEPSLATYYHVLGVFYKPPLTSRTPIEMLANIIQDIEGRSFTVQDPDDVYFFSSAMRLCLDLKDLDLAYRLQNIVDAGENWKLMGDQSLQSAYYFRFFNLLCLMENIDVVLKWYREFIPSRHYPNISSMSAFLQALEVGCRLNCLPQVWKDIKQMGLSNKGQLVEEILCLMARHEPEDEVNKTAFADIALDVKTLYESKPQMALLWNLSAEALGNISILLARGGRTEEAWNSLKLFKKHKLIPSAVVMDEVLDCAQANADTSLAINVVQLAAGFSLPNTADIAQRIVNEFTITEEQKITLEDLHTLSSSSSSSSSESSDSDSDQEKE